MIITGHRGAVGTEPENTLRSFRRAVADGCDEIELDLRVSAEPIRRLVRREAEGLGFRESIDNKKLFTMLGVARGGGVAVVITIVIIVSAVGGGS